MDSERSDHDLPVDGNGTFNMQAKATQRLPLTPEWIENFAQLTDVEALRAFYDQFQDEFAWLANADDTMEKGGAPIGMVPSEGNPDGLTPSMLLYGKDIVEVNRTCISMLSLKWLLNQEYKTFTDYQLIHQSDRPKLTEESFDTLCAYLRDVLHSQGQGQPVTRLTALLVAVVIGDIGKDALLEEKVKDFLKKKHLGKDTDLSWIEKMNHDEIVYQAACHEMLTAMNLLRGDLQKDVILGLRIGSNINVPQTAQAENVPGSLVFLEQLKGEDQAFRLKYMEVILDVAGARGHIDARGAVNMNDGTYQGYASCRSALESIIAGTRNIRQGYDQVLKQRAKMLDSKGVRLLHTDVPSERALLRLMCLGRVDNSADAEAIISAFEGLRNTTRQRLVDGLSVDGYQDGEAILLYYMPAVFFSIFQELKSSPIGKRIEALKSVMRFMVRGFNGSKPRPGQKGSIRELYIGGATQTTRSVDFARDPSVLDKVDPYVLDRNYRAERAQKAEEEAKRKEERRLRKAAKVS